MSINLNKYQPTSINNIVFGNINAELKIKRIVSGQKSFPAVGKQALLLYGVWGTGKSTLAKLLPDAIEMIKSGNICGGNAFIRKCKQGDNGAQLIDKIERQTSFISPSSSDLHYVVLDEVDMLTKNAQASLKGLLDNTSIVAILTTNNIQAIDKGIINRSHLIEMNAAQPQQWLPLCQQILNDMGVSTVSNQRLIPIIAAAKGSVRDIADGIEDLALTIKAAQQPVTQSSPLCAVK